ncbi:hydrogenase-4 component B [Andreesenia angusta]|uniref:Hydrogenase-4 component B n=1 Tax=Andreesenia angusta TaxID=39480 RepID=A0A1S1V4V4_9FIRM|nr:proton-conducting transporter membrane subunit [Andreesenia angusta]OHW61726.1 hydrogenase-4 component B [Andreesenia angusta]
MYYKVLLMTLLVLPAVGGVLAFLIGRKSEKARDFFNVLLTGMEFLILTSMYSEVRRNGIEISVPDVMGTGFHIKLDTMRYIFTWITVFVWFLTTVYSTQYLINYKNRNRYYAFFLLTLSATVGVFVSENIVNLFTFFEIMSFTSYILIIHDEDRYALDAGKSYIGMAIGGSLILLMGIFLVFDYTGAIDLSDIQKEMALMGDIKYFIAGLLLTGFGVKASAFPLHVWLPKAHPAAPTPASAILSGILIKTGIFGIMIVAINIMGGDERISYVLTTIGMINMALGGILAMYQRNIKSVLAYSSMSQSGYIIFGIGLVGILKEDGYIAVYGALYHIVNHAIFKVLLFYVAGLIYMVLHELSINKIKGFGKYKHFLKLLYLIGFFSIIGMPGFNGFVSKTILHEALAEAHSITHSAYFTVAEVVFTASSAFTVAYLSKIFFSVFMYDNPKYQGQHKRFITKRALLPIAVLSACTLYIGLKPGFVMEIISEAAKSFGVEGTHELHIYSSHTVASSLKTIGIGIAVYVLFIRGYLLRNINGTIDYINPSLEWFSLEKNIYKPMILGIYRFGSKLFHAVDNIFIGGATKITGSIEKVLIKEISPVEIKRKLYMMVRGLDSAVGDQIDFEKITVRELILNARLRLNSITYSLFIFAIILSVTLLLLMLYY